MSLLPPSYTRVFLFIITTALLYHQAASQEINLREVERHRVLAAADGYLTDQPITITSSTSPRSAGGLHDYFSEGDYWWPDPKNPDGPYIQRDGMTNPENFVAHRKALMRFSVQTAALTVAYVLTGDTRYAEHAARHCRAWFVDSTTLMNPHLTYAQAIKGKVTGRGVGIIDTIHLLEIAKSIPILEHSGSLSLKDAQLIRTWFAAYLTWMTTHQYGRDERDAKNNHATCWVLQVAAFAELTHNTALLDSCRRRFKEVLLPGQMAADGSFPLELKRTKPYGYSLFNLDAMAGICQVLSTPANNLWTRTLEDGRSMRKAMQFMVPYIENKSVWPYPPDVMYYENWPVRQPALLFAGLALRDQKWIQLWKSLDPEPGVEEVVRNYPIRQPLLWVKSGDAFPDVYLIDAATLDSVRMLYGVGKIKKNPALKKLLRQADKALTVKPLSVVDKEQTPPSGDRHDYMSVAPYWWPDTTKPDGLPYIRRDGERNPDRAKVGDRQRLGDMVDAVRDLALAFYITRREDFAAHAALLLQTWFLNPDTRMSPNLNYAQAIRGRNEGRGAGVIDGYGFSEVVDALGLLQSSTAWTDANQQGMTSWYTSYLTWLLTSENGQKECEAKNNHGTTYDVQVSTIALFIGNDSLARAVISNVPSKRIARQIMPDGSQPLELIRTKSWGYCLLNLEGLMKLARIGERFGIDLWHYETPDGRGIRKVIDWMIPFAIGEKEWTYTQIVPMEKERMYPILQVAAIVYGEPRYAGLRDRIPYDDQAKDRCHLLFPEPSQ